MNNALTLVFSARAVPKGVKLCVKLYHYVQPSKINTLKFSGRQATYTYNPSKFLLNGEDSFREFLGACLPGVASAKSGKCFCELSAVGNVWELLKPFPSFFTKRGKIVC